MLDDLFELGASMREPEKKNSKRSSALCLQNKKIVYFFPVLFCLYCLAIDPRIQEKVYQEIVSVMGCDDPGTPVQAEHINKLTYLKAFVKETFRLWPNGTEISRFIEKDMKLSGHVIPAGTHVDLNPSVHFRYA